MLRQTNKYYMYGMHNYLVGVCKEGFEPNQIIIKFNLLSYEKIHA